MKGREILNEYPAAAKVVTAWLLNELIKSCDNPDIPGDFKDYVIQLGLSEDRVADIIDDSPCMLFEVFDAHNIFIDIAYSSKGFVSRVYTNEQINQMSSELSEKRKQADLKGLIFAFELFNKSLINSVKVIDQEIINEENIEK